MTHWKHKSKFKGQRFLAGRELVEMYDSRNVGCTPLKVMLKLKNVKTGRELKDIFGNAQALKSAGWVKCKK